MQAEECEKSESRFVMKRVETLSGSKDSQLSRGA